MKEIPVTQSSMPTFDEYVEEIRPIWESKWLTNYGEKHRQLEQKLQKYLKVPYCSLAVNGHNALEAVIEALDLQGEIITTPFTFISTTNAIVRRNCTPIFCDIREDDFTLDADKVESLITDKTCAIIPVHVYGNICDNKKLQSIATKHGLKLIYDAAHAFGEEVNGIGIGSFGDASMLSFHATKVFHTIEGGAITTKDRDLYQKLVHVKDFGITGYETVEYVGGNAKMTEFSAAMGLCNLRHVDDAIAKRKMISDFYREQLSNVPGITMSVIQAGVKYNYSYFPIVVNPEIYGINRDELFEILLSNGIRSRKYFYPLTSLSTPIKKNFSPNETPVAERISNNVLTLPLYEELNLTDAARITDIIRSR